MNDIKRIAPDSAELAELKRQRRDAGLQIDPETAMTIWWFAQTFDPYGDGIEIACEEECVERTYFARAPSSEPWVWFGDLPADVREKLWERDGHKLAFIVGP